MRLSKATRREWIGLAIITLPCILYSMDLTVLNLAVPSIGIDLQPTAAQLLWIVDVYGFFASGSLLVMGTLGDRIGRRKLLLIGTAAFGLLSLVAAYAKSADILIVVRALLGIAGASMAPSTLSLISNMFHDEREKAFAVSVWVASFSLGGAMGPAIGGLVLSHFQWGAVFLVAIPVAALVLVAGPLMLPEFKEPESRSIDIASAAMSLAAVLPVIYGVKHAAESGDFVRAASAVALGSVFGALFVRRQMTLRDPLLDLRLFQRPALTAALVVYAVGFFVGFGMLVLVSQYFQLVLGLAPLKAGLWSIPAGLGFVVGALLTSAELKLMRPAYVVGLGLALGSMGLVVMAHAVGSRTLIFVVLGNVLFSIGTAPVVSIVADLVLSAAPKEQSGVAAALSELASEFGGALGIALLGSIATFFYRSTLLELAPSGIPADALKTALRGLGSASGLESALGGNDALLAAARSAYIRAADITLSTSAGILLVAAAFAVAMFRKMGLNR